jgi:hypothetical protein
MDTKNIIKESKAKFNHNSAKEYLKDKYNNKLLFAEQGGLWKITPELLATLSSYPEESLILVDNYDTPILINREPFLKNALDRYKTAMKDYCNEWAELKKNR